MSLAQSEREEALHEGVSAPDKPRTVEIVRSDYDLWTFR